MITREDAIEQSVSDYVRGELVARGYTVAKVQVREMFPSQDERATELELTQVAIGFNFDDGGKLVEMGSDLTRRVYTIEFWTFGATPTYGRNVANVIRAIVEDAGGLVPLKDVGTAGQPVIDQLQVLDEGGVRVTRQIASDPLPWDRNVWTTAVKIEDYYSPALVEN